MVNKSRKNYWAIKHDMSHSIIYRRYRDMISRCFRKNACNYKHYGARGISVCDEWANKENGFLNFYNWSMMNGYNENLSIDRIDNDGNYEPSNCRWATKSVQNMSMRHKNTSGYVGISKHSMSDRWYGRVKVDKKCHYTGMSKNIHEAAKMRNDYIISNGLDNMLNDIKEMVNEKTLYG